jgi:uncharacterized protein YktB (UPF0637 family)
VSDRLEARQRERIEGLQARVRELEETVHYLFKTLQQHGVIDDTVASVGDRMYAQGRDIRRQTGTR